MYLDLSTISPGQVYASLIQTILPRPIAWVLTQNDNDSLNLAPFSFFNAVCSDPPLIMLSIGKKPNHANKDTAVNIERQAQFVIHIPHQELAEAVTQSSASFEYGESELQHLKLATTPFEGFALPRLATCRVAFACSLFEIREIGNAHQTMILGRVERMYIDDSITDEDAKGRLRVGAEKLDPLGRLGGSEYTTMGTILNIPRPA